MEDTALSPNCVETETTWLSTYPMLKKLEYDLCLTAEQKERDLNYFITQEDSIITHMANHACSPFMDTHHVHLA